MARCSHCSASSRLQLCRKCGKAVCTTHVSLHARLHESERPAARRNDDSPSSSSSSVSSLFDTLPSPSLDSYSSNSDSGSSSSSYDSGSSSYDSGSSGGGGDFGGGGASGGDM